VQDFIRTIKLNKAAEMLLTQDININEVAYAVGLDSTNFSRNFSKQFGLPPKKYIQKNKK